MPDLSHPGLKAAVEAVTSRAAPDFAAVYARASKNNGLKWTGFSLTLAGVAAAILFTLTLPSATPNFNRQVAAFVDLVYED